MDRKHCKQQFEQKMQHNCDDLIIGIKETQAKVNELRTRCDSIKRSAKSPFVMNRSFDRPPPKLTPSRYINETFQSSQSFIAPQPSSNQNENPQIQRQFEEMQFKIDTLEAKQRAKDRELSYLQASIKQHQSQMKEIQAIEDNYKEETHQLNKELENWKEKYFSNLKEYQIRQAQQQRTYQQEQKTLVNKYETIIKQQEKDMESMELRYDNEREQLLQMVYSQDEIQSYKQDIEKLAEQLTISTSHSDSLKNHITQQSREFADILEAKKLEIEKLQQQLAQKQQCNCIDQINALKEEVKQAYTNNELLIEQETELSHQLVQERERLEKLNEYYQDIEQDNQNQIQHIKQQLIDNHNDEIKQLQKKHQQEYQNQAKVIDQLEYQIEQKDISIKSYQDDLESIYLKMQSVQEQDNEENLELLRQKLELDHQQDIKGYLEQINTQEELHQQGLLKIVQLNAEIELKDNEIKNQSVQLQQLTQQLNKLEEKRLVQEQINITNMTSMKQQLEQQQKLQNQEIVNLFVEEYLEHLLLNSLEQQLSQQLQQAQCQIISLQAQQDRTAQLQQQYLQNNNIKLKQLQDINENLQNQLLIQTGELEKKQNELMEAQLSNTKQIVNDESKCELSKLNNEILELHTHLKVKDEQINTLSKELLELQQVSAEQSKQISQRDNDIVVLKESLEFQHASRKELQQIITDLNNIIKEQESEIEALNQKLADNEDYQSEVEQQSQQQQEQLQIKVDNANAQFEQFQITLNTLTIESAQKELIIQEQYNSIIELKTLSQENQAELEKQYQIIQGLQVEIEQLKLKFKEEILELQLIVEKQSQSHDTSTQNIDQNNKLQQQEQTIAELQELNNELQDQITESNNKLNLYLVTINNLEIELSINQQMIQQLEIEKNDNQMLKQDEHNPLVQQIEQQGLQELQALVQQWKQLFIEQESIGKQQALNIHKLTAEINQLKEDHQVAISVKQQQGQSDNIGE